MESKAARCLVIAHNIFRRVASRPLTCLAASGSSVPVRSCQDMAKVPGLIRFALG